MSQYESALMTMVMDDHAGCGSDVMAVMEMREKPTPANIILLNIHFSSLKTR